MGPGEAACYGLRAGEVMSERHERRTWPDVALRGLRRVLLSALRELRALRQGSTETRAGA
jgi:hypothetical protein